MPTQLARLKGISKELLQTIQAEKRIDLVYFLWEVPGVLRKKTKDKGLYSDYGKPGKETLYIQNCWTLINYMELGYSETYFVIWMEISEYVEGG